MPFEPLIKWAKNHDQLIVIILLAFLALFIAGINYPPLFSLWENSVVYNNFLPGMHPPLILAIQEGGDSVGFHGLGYVLLTSSRYLADVLGHSISVIRLLPVLYGLISLLLLYVIVKRWFGWKTAALSTVLLMTNINFIIFEHTLMVQIPTMMCMLFLIERFQYFRQKQGLFSIITLGLACALLSLHQIPGRIYMLAVLVFYLFEFDKIIIKSGINNIIKIFLERALNLLKILVSMIVFLFIFCPFNMLLLFNKEFIFSKLGEYSTSTASSLLAVAHNAIYFVNYFILGNLSNNTPIDIMLTIPYPLESLAVILLGIFAVIVYLKQIGKYEFKFLYYSLAVLALAPLFSSIYPEAEFVMSSSCGIPRVFYLIPFVDLFAVLGVVWIYSRINPIRSILKWGFVALIAVMLLLRFGSLINEVKRFDSYINGFSFDFSRPAVAKKYYVQKDPPEHDYPVREKRELLINQVYYYKLAEYIADNLEENDQQKSVDKKTLYVPENYYTPDYYRFGGGDIPNKGHAYYLPMYLTFYLREKGVNVSYLVKIKDIQPPFFNRFLGKLQKHKLGRFLKDFTLSEPRIDSDLKIGREYIVATTGFKKPEYILITNKAELNAYRTIANKQIVLKLPDNIKED